MDPNPGPSFQGQFSQPGDYSLQPEGDPDSIESFGTAQPSHPSGYTNGGAVDPRRDGVANSAFAIAPIRSTHSARFAPDHAVAPDGSYRPGNSYPESNPNSISASPSSGSSQFAYNNSIHTLPVSHYTTLPAPQTFQNSLVHQPILQSYPNSFRPPGTIDNSASNLVHLPNPNIPRSPISNSHHPGDRDSFASPLLGRPQYPLSNYSSFEIPRTGVPSTSLYPVHPVTYGHSMPGIGSPGARNGPGHDKDDCSNFPWPNLECVTDLHYNGQTIVPDIKAVVEKGFFLEESEMKWTCYRRNYFSVNCGYTLSPNVPDGARLCVKKTSDSAPQMVQAIGIRVCAAVDGSQGKSIDLVLHTPKRDAGPKLKIEITRLLPQASGVNAERSHMLTPHGLSSHTHMHGPIASSSGMYNPTQMSAYHPTGAVSSPHLPYQNVPLPNPEGGANDTTANQGNQSQASAQFTFSPGGPHAPQPGSTTSHTFERIQFKCATANNGKRRASQQYFHLIAELYVDIRKDGANQPSWHLIARRTSDKIVVRGRSPSHYQNENSRNGANRSNGSVNGSRYAPPSSSGSMTYGSIPHGMPRAAGGYPSAGYGIGLAPGFRPMNDGFNDDSGDSIGSHTPDSANGGTFDGQHSPEMMEADRAGIENPEQYTYHPAAMYEPASINNHLPPPRPDRFPRLSTDPGQHFAHAFKTDFPDGTPGPQWQTNGGLSRFHGFDTSRNIFPDVHGAGSSYS